MMLKYEIDDKYLATLKIDNSEIKQIISRDFRGRFKAIRYLFYNCYGIKLFSINWMEKTIIDNGIGFIFGIDTKIGNFTINIKDDNITISNEIGSFTFIYDNFETIEELCLKEMIILQKDRIIVERFLEHQLEMEIHFPNNHKIYYLNIPLDMDETFDVNYCSFINATSSIIDLKRFYIMLFWKQQSDYDRLKREVVLSIWYKSDAFNGDKIKVEELILRNGMIENYQIGSVYPRKNTEPVIVIMKDNTFTIMGFEDNAGLDINEAMVYLLERQKKLK